MAEVDIKVGCVHCVCVHMLSSINMGTVCKIDSQSELADMIQGAHSSAL